MWHHPRIYAMASWPCFPYQDVKTVKSPERKISFRQLKLHKQLHYLPVFQTFQTTKSGSLPGTKAASVPNNACVDALQVRWVQRYSALSQYIFNKQQLVVHTITNPWFGLPYWASMFTGLSTCISDEESNRRKLFSAACPSFVLACPKSLNRPLNKQALDLIYSKAVLTWKIKEIGLQADIFEGKRDQAI